MPPALQAACGDGPRRAWQPSVRAPAQPQSRGQTTVPAEGPESRKDLKGLVSLSAGSSQQPPAARLPRGPRVSQRDSGTACPPPPRPRIEHGAREAHWAGAAVPSACTAPGHSGAHRTSSTGPGNAGSSSATGSAHGGVSRACCGATRESKTLGYKGPTRSRMLHADAVPGWGSRVDAPSLTLAAASEPLSSSPGFAKAALWAVCRQRGPRGAQGRVRRDCGDLSVRRG